MNAPQDVIGIFLDIELHALSINMKDCENKM